MTIINGKTINDVSPHGNNVHKIDNDVAMITMFYPSHEKHDLAFF